MKTIKHETKDCAPKVRMMMDLEQMLYRTEKDGFYLLAQNQFDAANLIKGLVELIEVEVEATRIIHGAIMLHVRAVEYTVEADDDCPTGREFCQKDHNGLNEGCPHCDTTVELEYIFHAQPCPGCGEMILPCNFCPHMDSECYDPDMCSRCPIESEKGSRGVKRFMQMDNMQRLELMEQLGVADDCLEDALDACFEHLTGCSEVYIDEEEDAEYLNKYRCECGEEWEDEWSCMCNDRCPSCNSEIEPYESIELGGGEA